MNRLAFAFAVYFTYAGFCVADTVEDLVFLKQEAFLEQITPNGTPINGESSLDSNLNLEYETPYSVSGDSIPSLLTEKTLSSVSAYGDSFSIAPLVGDTLFTCLMVSP